MKVRILSNAILLASLAMLPSAQAAVTLPNCFSEHMVLQRDSPIPIWGWASPGESVTVKLGDGAAVKTSAGANGSWKVRLPAMPAGGPFVMQISGSNEIRFTDVLVGEVWLCSGQSNMEFTVQSSLNFDQERPAATDGHIRQLGVNWIAADNPAPNTASSWAVCSPDSVGWFTACGYFMARKLRHELNVPIGLIKASWGGTRIEPWTPPEGFAMVPALDSISKALALLDPKNPGYQTGIRQQIDAVNAWTVAAREALAKGQVVPPSPGFPPQLQPLCSRTNEPFEQPTTLFNGMIYSVVGYGMRGAIWYQGESNRTEPLYTEKMQALIGGWRKLWSIGDFPFNFVQIAPCTCEDNPMLLPRFWTAQAAALAIPNTGMVVTNDIGTLNNIHPPNKQEVGRRLALLALARTYGRKDIVCEGPKFMTAVPEGNKLRVFFSNAAGLTTRDGKAPTWFEIGSEEGDFVPATAAIDGTTVVLSSPQVAKPVAMRFAWNRDAEPNLMNGAGLPCGAFTSCGVASSDPLAKIPDAKDYELVYSLDLARLGLDLAGRGGHEITYDIDWSARITRPFDRIGYLLELQADGRPARWVWASMDAFTTDVKKIAIPTFASGAFFQQEISNLVVASNAGGITTGTFATGGNLEFWSGNYTPANAKNVPGASNDSFDWGDTGERGDGYGSMQIHNYSARQTLLAINHWGLGGNSADIGIGNSSGQNSDWTGLANAVSYQVKKLRVLVRLKR